MKRNKGVKTTAQEEGGDKKESGDHFIGRHIQMNDSFFFNGTAANEIYTLHIVGSVGCV